MNDNVCVIDEFRKEVLIFNAVKVIREIFRTFQVPDVLHATGGEVVQKVDLVTLLEQPFREVRTDKSRTTRDEISQRSLLIVCRNRHGRRGRPERGRVNPRRVLSPGLPGDRNRKNRDNTGRNSNNPERSNPQRLARPPA